MSQEDTLSQHFAGAFLPPPSETEEKTQLFVVTKGPMALFMVCLNCGDGQPCLNFASDELDKSLGDFK